MYDILRMLYIDVHWMYIVEELGCICGSGKSGKGGEEERGGRTKVQANSNSSNHSHNSR